MPVPNSVTLTPNFFSFVCLGFPIDTELREKAASRRVLFGDGLVAVGAVVAHRRPADEKFRLVFCLSHSIDQGARCIDPARTKKRFLGLAPTLPGNQFPCQINHTVCAVDGGFPHASCRGIPREPFFFPDTGFSGRLAAEQYQRMELVP